MVIVFRPLTWIGEEKKEFLEQEDAQERGRSAHGVSTGRAHMHTLLLHVHSLTQCSLEQKKFFFLPPKTYIFERKGRSQEPRSNIKDWRRSLGHVRFS